jgi:hypothetical protein
VGFRFALRLDDGGDAGDVGTFTTASRHWKPADEFFDSERAHWRVLSVPDIEPQRPGDVDGVLVVELV